MNPEMMIKPADTAHRAYARGLANELKRHFGLTYENERWLAERLQQAFSEYEKGLEQMCNSYAQMANEALNLKMPLPFIANSPAPDK